MTVGVSLSFAGRHQILCLAAVVDKKPPRGGWAGGARRLSPWIGDSGNENCVIDRDGLSGAASHFIDKRTLQPFESLAKATRRAVIDKNAYLDRAWLVAAIAEHAACPGCKAVDRPGRPVEIVADIDVDVIVVCHSRQSRPEHRRSNDDNFE